MGPAAATLGTYQVTSTHATRVNVATTTTPTAGAAATAAAARDKAHCPVVVVPPPALSGRGPNGGVGGGATVSEAELDTQYGTTRQTLVTGVHYRLGYMGLGASCAGCQQRGD